MQLQLEAVAVGMLIVAILGGIVTITRYITKLQSKLRQTRLTQEKSELAHKLRVIGDRYNELLNQINASQKSSTLALALRIEIEQDLTQLMRALDAEAGSIFIPVRSQQTYEPVGLVFLAILPINSQTSSLRKKIIPLAHSLAGRAFRSGKSLVAIDTKLEPNHFHQADKVSGFQTRDTVTVPLKYQGSIIGVLQLLNRPAEKHVFTREDVPGIEVFAHDIAGKVAEYCKYPDHLALLGISTQQGLDIATIMFCDMTNSSVLFKHMNPLIAIQHINEFLASICDVAFEYGATIDKYTGDGVFLRFNVPHRIIDHPRKAILASMEMRNQFVKLKGGWMALDASVAPIHLRISLALGPVYQATIGHPQSQYVTLFGTAVNTAANLCEVANRQSNMITIDEALYQAIKTMVQVKPLEQKEIGKAIAYTNFAYAVSGLKDISI